MRIELRVPTVGESISEVEIGGWLRKTGEAVQKDQPVVALESEKATVELPAPESGVMGELLKQKGEVAKVGEVIGYLEAGVTATGSPAPQRSTGEAAAVMESKAAQPGSKTPPRVMPAAAKALAEHHLQTEEVQPTGPGGRLLKEDVLRHVQHSQAKPAPGATDTQVIAKSEMPPLGGVASTGGPARQPGREEEVVPMSRLRRTIAERLVEAQHMAALLTTINEIDLTAVAALRKEFGEVFQQKHGVKLGFMSFFVKAVIDGLKQYPVINAEIRGTNIVYHNYFDIGIAVGSGKGLVVPVLRNAEHMSFAEIETAISDLGKRARENKLKLEELQGGTFTITNGGIYGSLLSTPIVNPPQSGVLGMHAIQERPVAREGQVVIRPMMYVALTYDHRIVDGREAVSFLKHLKDVLETPARMLIEV